MSSTTRARPFVSSLVVLLLTAMNLGVALRPLPQPTPTATATPVPAGSQVPASNDPVVRSTVRVQAEAARVVRLYVAARRAGRADEARNLVRELRALLDRFEQRGNQPHLDEGPIRTHIVRAWCVRELGDATTPTNLDPMQEVEYAYMFVPPADPTIYLLHFASQWEDVNFVPSRIIRQMTRDYYSDMRLGYYLRICKDVMPPLEGRTVAVAHCGCGPMLAWMARKIGPSGKLIAQEMYPEVFDFISFAAGHGVPELKAVEQVSGVEDDTRLPAGIDVIFLDDAHANFLREESLAGPLSDDFPQVRWMRSMARALKPGGCIVITEDDLSISRFAAPGPEPLSLKGNLRLLEMAGLRVEKLVKGEGFFAIRARK